MKGSRFTEDQIIGILGEQEAGSMAEPSSNPSSKPNAKRADWSSSCCRPSGPTSTAASNAPDRLGDMSSMQLTICRSNRQITGLRRRLSPKVQPHRSHDSLAGQSPAEYLQPLGQGDPPPSHMY